MRRRPFGERRSRLRDLRRAQGLSQAELARAIRMSKNTIGAMERGELRDPRYIRQWEKVARFFGVTLEDIYRLPTHVRRAAGGWDAGAPAHDWAQELHAQYRRSEEH